MFSLSANDVLDGLPRDVHGAWTSACNEHERAVSEASELEDRVQWVNFSQDVLLAEFTLSLNSQRSSFVDDACNTRDYICRRKGLRLEPFQREIFNAVVASRLDRVYGVNSHKYRIKGLAKLGVINDNDFARFSRNDVSKDFSRRLAEICEEYSRKYIVVKAPRRSGKNVAAQIAVATLLVHEPNVVVVNWAQNIRCAELNCEQISDLLNICRDRYPGLEVQTAKDCLTIYPKVGSRSTLRIKPNTANVSIHLYYINIFHIEHEALSR
jgi:hypothetical protein